MYIISTYFVEVYINKPIKCFWNHPKFILKIHNYESLSFWNSFLFLTL